MRKTNILHSSVFSFISYHRKRPKYCASKKSILRNIIAQCSGLWFDILQIT